MSLWHKHPAVRTGDQLTIGERAADRMRNVFGSWAFVFGFFAFMGCWAVANSLLHVGGAHGKHGFDPWPYIALNLALSALAGVQAALLLIAAKRSDQISSEVAVHTERTADDIKTLLEANTELTREVHDLALAVHDHMIKEGT